MVSDTLIRMVIVAVGMICFDILTGVVAAFATGTFKSSVMRKGGWHKLTLLCAVAFGVFLDIAQQMVDLGVSIPCGSAICGYIVLMECLSTIENLNKGFPGVIPRSIMQAFNTAVGEDGAHDN